MTKDEQEALSKNYSSDMIQLLPLSSGSIAVFNRGGELLAIYGEEQRALGADVWQFALARWRPPAQARHRASAAALSLLEELGL